MKLERVAARLRPRSQAEASDLGLRLAWHWWRTSFATWLAVALPFFSIALLVFRESPLWGLLLIWWVKPLLDTVLLEIYSQALFGNKLTVGSALRRVPGVWRRTALSALTLWRLDPLRMVSMPIKQLEGLSGRAMLARRSLLARAMGGELLRVTGVFLLFEMSLVLTPFLSTLFFAPDSGSETWFDVTGVHALAAQRLWVGCYIFAIAVLEPFFVGSGFSLYINRRTHLEAWDIELAFRKMARRIEQMLKVSAVVAVGLVTMASLATPAENSTATPDAPRLADRRIAAEETIETVLASEDFGGEETRNSWQWAGSRRESSSSSRALPPIGGALAAAIEPVMWIAMIALVSFLVYRILVQLDSTDLAGSARSRKRSPSVVMGMDVREEHLPDDVTAAATELWHAGDYRAALRLLYRASIARMIARDGVVIESSATEDDVLQAASGALEPSRLDYFRALTGVWQTTAYGHRTPGQHDRQLVESWPDNFEATP